MAFRHGGILPVRRPAARRSKLVVEDQMASRSIHAVFDGQRTPRRGRRVPGPDVYSPAGRRRRDHPVPAARLCRSACISADGPAARRRRASAPRVRNGHHRATRVSSSIATRPATAGSIGPGDVQWMTAALGLVHEEKHGQRVRSRAAARSRWCSSGSTCPARTRCCRLRYQDIRAGDIPTVALPKRRRNGARHCRDGRRPQRSRAHVHAGGGLRTSG